MLYESEFQVERKQFYKLFHKQGNFTWVVQRVILGKLQYRIWNPNRIPKSEKKKLLKLIHKQGN